MIHSERKLTVSGLTLEEITRGSVQSGGTTRDLELLVITGEAESMGDALVRMLRRDAAQRAREGADTRKMIDCGTVTIDDDGEIKIVANDSHQLTFNWS